MKLIKIIIFMAIAIFIPWICIMLASEFVWAGDFSWNPYGWIPQGRALYFVFQAVFSLAFGRFVYAIYERYKYLDLEVIRFRVRLFFLKIKYRKIIKKSKKLRDESIDARERIIAANRKEIKAIIDQAEKELVDNFFNKGVGK